MTNGNENVYPVVLQHGLTHDSWVEVGLTKREYFAAMAMQGVLADRDFYRRNSIGISAVALAVNFADSLIAELNNEEQP